MPRQNRVDPAGNLVAVGAHGTFMGNRGRLHDTDGRIVRHSDRPQWVSCVLEYKGGTKRPEGRRYTELFFLDEATALAAGHRPCNTCRRSDARLFAQAWARANTGLERAPAPDIDKVLSAERSLPSRPLIEDCSGLPDGTIVRQDASEQFHLIRNGYALLWSFEGYSHPLPATAIRGPFSIMTPSSIVRALAAGYRPHLHPSAG